MSQIDHPQPFALSMCSVLVTLLVNWEEAPHSLEPGSCCENCLGLGPGAKGHCFFGWMCLHPLVALVPWTYAVLGLCVADPWSPEPWQAGIFHFGVSTGVGMVFGLECGWCGVTNKI